MASAVPLRPLTFHHRFLTSRNNWSQFTNAAAASAVVNPSLKFISTNLHRSVSICPPLSSLFRPGSPHFRPSLRLMTTTHAASEPPQSSTKTVRLVIKGRVQGVFYRNWTVENATQLGLKGWVRNRSDGSVETLLSGNPDAVQEMEQRCRRGPPSSMVTGLESYPSTDDPGTGFECKQTIWDKKIDR